MACSREPAPPLFLNRPPGIMPENNKKPDLSDPVFSGETQNRTVDTTIFSRMLYQLSYLGKPLFFNNGYILAGFPFYVKRFNFFMTITETGFSASIR